MGQEIGYIESEIYYYPPYSPPDYRDWYPPTYYPTPIYPEYYWYWYPTNYVYCPYCGRRLKSHKCGE